MLRNPGSCIYSLWTILRNFSPTSGFKWLRYIPRFHHRRQFLYRFFFSKRHCLDHFSCGKSLVDCLVNCIINFCSSCKPHLHLAWMHIYIQIISLHLNMKRNKGKLMLHEKTLIGILYPLCNDPVLYKTSVNIIILTGTVTSGNLRFSHKTLNLHEIILVGYLKKCFGDISSIYIIDHIFHIVISGSMKLHLFILDIFKRNLRMGQCQLLHQSADIISLRSI